MGPNDAAVVRLARWKKRASQFAMGFVLAFFLMSLLAFREAATHLFPIMLMALAAYTGISGLIAFRTGITGVGVIDTNGKGRMVGAVWIAVACVVFLFAVSYFFTGALS